MCCGEEVGVATLTAVTFGTKAINAANASSFFHPTTPTGLGQGTGLPTLHTTFNPVNGPRASRPDQTQPYDLSSLLQSSEVPDL